MPYITFCREGLYYLIKLDIIIIIIYTAYQMYTECDKIWWNEYCKDYRSNLM